MGLAPFSARTRANDVPCNANPITTTTMHTPTLVLRSCDLPAQLCQLLVHSCLLCLVHCGHLTIGP